MKEMNWMFEYKGFLMKMVSNPEVFSPQGIDKGTLAMLSFVNFNKFHRVLDLGCGSGIVGIFASKFVGGENVVMVDKSSKAVECAIKNCMNNGCPEIEVLLSDGFEELDQKKFDLILSNPPYHEDFSVPKRFIEDSFKKLEIGGYMYMVTKRKKWYKNKLISVFGGVQIKEKDGYFVFISQKKWEHKKRHKESLPMMSKKIRKKMERRKKKSGN